MLGRSKIREDLTVAQIRDSLLAELKTEIDRQLAPIKQTLTELRGLRSREVPAHSHGTERHWHNEYVDLREFEAWKELVRKLDREVAAVDEQLSNWAYDSPRSRGKSTL